MIEIKGLSKSFNGRVVLDDISANFQQGKTNMVIGGSGTGKSVLLKCMIGILVPERGKVLYDGRDFLKAHQDVVKEIRREMGVLFQGGALFDSKSVLENVRFPLDTLTSQTLEEKNAQAMLCLQRVGLESAALLMPSEISGGMKKRVGIARAIVMNPKYLFCDEPNSGLDPLTAVKIDYLIQEITQEYNMTTVVISHDMNSVMRMGESIIFLKDGKKIWEGNSDTFHHSGVPELEEFLSTKLV
ncbi:ABC transporter ATP-binding protein [Aquirufa antheringensis]|jgi:phospholipid/cholesterol/gamma-HCH transport system ATP-binding protein|uniref:ATP-binding cassette domain-containing protein n=1 Tax=Aquirufa antheringensis TaxID=2516559 RepID=A0A4Q9BEH2_9BACT|nr:ATP-binding cassette domain-containing protein [Aquirufa antheringensis]MCE4216918.1 ATP-binding cassette domain-containing protein [Pseudarcicella sp. GAP-15]MCL9968342.1 ATP-binding cassette domain-containing protein [Aquirufa antheringensis]MCZ2478147.1 ATP-binding cassette domain-containing protein [Aquirufa antheringensis]MCZ2484188.1 ATP-binding cassette domain-containing protein [Aquirufa antheringensis]MCZ2487945.1 ATP-binding cassette domain-containing protein [Aquirufa antheringen